MTLEIGTRVKIPRLGHVEIMKGPYTPEWAKVEGEDVEYYAYRRVLGRGTERERLSTNAYVINREYAESLEVVG